MRTYKLSAAGSPPYGDGLVEEIRAVHGVDVSRAYGYIAPDNIQVGDDFDGCDLAAVVAAHVTPPAMLLPVGEG